ncbi:MAG: hypothetical protein ABR907_14180 [Terracidiphilus sp.]
MNRKLSLSILAGFAAVLMPLAATSQIAPERQKRAETEEVTYKWEAFAGYGYTSINQINGSRYGLQGMEVSVTRDWGKHFGIAGDGAFYSKPISSSTPLNPCPTTAPCSPSVDAVLFGPVLRFPLYEKMDGFIRVLAGGVHSGGELQTPNISFAGGAGGGVDYKLTSHWLVRASGDDIASSFSFIDNTVASGHAYSPHVLRNSRMAVGIVYRF